MAKKSTGKAKRGRGRPPKEAKAIRGADGVTSVALAAFAEYGYHGTSVRDLAERQGLTVAAIYYHFPSKLDILVAIMTRAMDDILADSERALEESPGDPASRLAAFVRAIVLFHTRRQAESFVGNSELRSLAGANREAIVSRRDRQEQMLRSIVDEGIEQGVFSTAEPDEVTRAILAMCIAVHVWYQPGGELTPETIADRYVGLASALVGAAQ